MSVKKLISDLLAQAEIQINGHHPWDIQVHNEEFYQRVWHDHELGLGESYVEGWWDCEQIDVCVNRILRAKLDQQVRRNTRLWLQTLLHALINYQTKQRSLEAAHRHYDLGNDLYRAMLGETMVYSCAYWKEATDLDQAQRHKMELICQKLMLQPGQTLLDIGCGWGSMACYAAEHYGVKVVGITISEQQQRLAAERCRHLPIEIRLQDYRDMGRERFDRIVSVGMFEHVGYKNYRSFMQIVRQLLTEEGFFLLHTIGNTITTVRGASWINKYIFPNGMLPSVTQIGQAIEGLLILEDWHNFGIYYDQTLMAWYHNFITHWPQLKAHYDERFFRLWSYYLLSCAGSFRARYLQLWQLALSPHGLEEGFQRRELQLPPPGWVSAEEKALCSRGAK